MLQTDIFSASYTIARNRFREAARNLGARLESFAIDQKGLNNEELTIDFALIGANQPKWVVIVSSGLHGVEGFFGSAVQLAWMQEVIAKVGFPIDPNGAVLLIHAINPYGFAWLRRTNEDNIDLNRNFLLPNESYNGAPPEYSQINHFLNPKSPLPLLDPFILTAIGYILRYGFQTLKQAIAGGQYEFSQGLFFGGHSPAKSTQIIQTYLPQWVNSANQILHLDFHTGLGKWANYKLFPAVWSSSFSYTSVFQQFGLDDSTDQVPYQVQGSMGSWLAHQLVPKNYIYFNAEFGTYSGIKVLAKLQAENRVHFYNRFDSHRYNRVKAQLLEAFCPKSHSWKQNVLIKGITLINKALEVCPKMPENFI